MGQDSSVLKSEVPFGHFGTGADCQNVQTLETYRNSAKVSQCRTVSGPKCLVTSPVTTTKISTIVTLLSQGHYRSTLYSLRRIERVSECVDLAHCH